MIYVPQFLKAADIFVTYWYHSVVVVYAAMLLLLFAVKLIAKKYCFIYHYCYYFIGYKVNSLSSGEMYELKFEWENVRPFFNIVLTNSQLTVT